MKRSCKKVKANSYFLGGFSLPTGAQAANIVGGGLDLTSSLIPSSGNAKTDAITSGIAGGLETVGSAFGPLGGVVGKAAGMLTKGIGALVGTSDSVNTDTGEYIKGRGIKGRRSRDRVRAQWRRVNQGLRDVEQTSQLQQDFADQYGNNDFSLAAYGGNIPTTLAYLDDGELVRTPSGQIAQIPEEGKPTDSNLMNVPVGTQVLSDKLKVPGTNKTFAEVGKKYMKKDNTKAKDRYAENSRMLNNRNNQKKYDELMALQEQVKAKRGIKKNKDNSYDDGTTKRGIRNVQSANDLNWVNDMMNTDWFRSTMSMITPDNYQEYNNMQNTYPTLGFGDTKPGDVTLTPNDAVNRYQGVFDNLTDMNAAIGDLYTKGRLKGRGGSHDKPETWRDGLAGDASWLRHLGRNVTPDQLKAINENLSGVTAYINPDNGMVNYRPVVGTVQQTRSSIPVPKADLNPQSIVRTSPVSTRQINPTSSVRNNILSTIGDALIGASNLIGPLANIYDSDPEIAPVRTYTPHFGPVDYNVDPLVQQANLTNAINRYNIDKAGGAGRGANLAQAVQSGVVRNRAIADAYSTKQNIENERRFKNAGIYNDWARWNVENRHRGDVENAQNRAAARNIRRTGLSQLGTALASMNRDRRYTARDRALLNYMRPYLEYGSTKDLVNNLYNQLS